MRLASAGRVSAVIIRLITSSDMPMSILMPRECVPARTAGSDHRVDPLGALHPHEALL